MGENIEIALADGVAGAYVARPSARSAPAVVVLHEVFGVNADIRSTCHEMAQLGLVEIAPELFWRQERGVELCHRSETDWRKGLSLYQAYDRDQGARDVAAVIAFARSLPGTTGRVGVMGYCLGGLMTFLAAARGEPDASIAYYPGAAEHYLGEARDVSAPMLVHLGSEDEFIDPGSRTAIAAAFSLIPWVQVFEYPGQGHAFARHDGAHFDAQAAELANARSRAFLRENLL